jgi:hypothetical protein
MADADLDAELLALAGGDSSDEEPSPRSEYKSASPPAPPSFNKPLSPEPAPEMARKGTVKPARRPKKPKKEESEEGELCVFGLSSLSGQHRGFMCSAGIDIVVM